MNIYFCDFFVLRGVLEQGDALAGGLGLGYGWAELGGYCTTEIREGFEMPSEGFRYDVFLSHSSKDKAVVRPLAERLRKDGVKVWFDEWEIQAGDSIPAKIEEGLEHSRVLVLCMSANAFGSDWAQLEAGTFRFRDPLNKDRRFIPLRLDDATIKGSLAQFLCLNWRTKDHEREYADLLETCRPPAKPKVAEANPASREVTPTKAVQLESKERILAYAFAPNGERVLTTAADGSIQLWDMLTGRKLRRFSPETARGTTEEGRLP